MAERGRLVADLHVKLSKQLHELDEREERLIDLAADGSLSAAKIQQRINSLRVERKRIDEALTNTNEELTVGALRLTEAIKLLNHPERLYGHASELRRQLNQTFWQHFMIDENPDRGVFAPSGVLRAPFDDLTQAARHPSDKESSHEKSPGVPARALSRLSMIFAGNDPVIGSSKNQMVVLTRHLSGLLETLGHLRAQVDVLPSLVDPALPVAAQARPRQTQRRLTLDEAAEVAAGYRSGLSMNQLARRHGVHRSNISNCLQKQQVQLRQLGLSPADVPAAAALYQAGWSLARLSDKYSTTDMTVRKALLDHGVQMRPRRGWTYDS